MIPKALEDEYARRFSEISWKGVRSFRVYFSDDTHREPIDILCKQLPDVKGELLVDDRGEILPSFWTCKSPFQIALRADDVEAIVEQVYGVEMADPGPDENEGHNE